MQNPFATVTLGLDRTPNSLKSALLVFRRGRPQIAALHEQPAKESVKQLYTSPTHPLKNFFNTPPLLAAGLPAKNILTRRIQLPPLKKKTHLFEAIAYQLEPQLPYPLEDAMLTYASHENGSHTVFAAPKKEVTAQLEKWDSLQTPLDQLIPLPAALAHFNGILPGHDTPRLYFHFGWEGVLCVSVLERKIEQAYFLPTGFGALAKALAEDLNLAEEEAQGRLFDQVHLLQTTHLPQLTRLLVKWGFELKRVYRYLCEGENPELLLLYEERPLHGLEPFLAQTLEREISPFPHSPLCDRSPQELQKYAVAIGLSLTAQASRPKVSYANKEVGLAAAWNKLKTPLRLYILTVLTITLLAVVGAWAALHRQAKELYKAAYEIAAVQQKLVPPPFRTPEEEGAGSVEEIIAQLQTYAQKIDTFAYPLAPGLPNVSEFLAWLAAHPIVYPPDAPPLKFEKIAYTMLQYPSMKNPKEHYRVRIDLEFTAASARQARDFHESLLAAGNLIALKEQVQWNARDGRYLASFYLRDKTPYP